MNPTSLPVQLGRYRLVALLGQGGMGTVFRAELRSDAGFRKDVAVKVVHPSGDADQNLEFQQAFLQEARIGARLKHPNVVDVYDFGVHEGQPWLAMELIPGRSLYVHLKEGALPPRAAIQAATQIARALAHVQKLQLDGSIVEVVHRDLKPSNILLTPYGLVKVMDFGLARPAGAPPPEEEEQVRGTLSYMAPEQLDGGVIDGRADQFALGVVLFEMLSGRRFFPRKGPRSALFQLPQLAEFLSDPDVLAPAENAAPGSTSLLLRMLAPHPDDRFRSMRAVVRALTALLEHQGPGTGLHDFLIPPPEETELSVWAPSPTGSDSIAGPRTNLGRERIGFLGRTDELIELEGLMGEGGRLVTLLGPGGVGKTRLARRHALDQVERFAEGGVWFVDLVDVDTPGGFGRAVAEALSLPSAASDALSAALGSRGPTLLVLDNLEQLLSATPLLADWLNTSPDLHLLTTSRRRLGIAGERVMELGPMSDEAARALLSARAAEAGIDSLDPVDVDTLLRLLDRLPLALELAAARLRFVELDRLVASMVDRFAVLRDEGGSLPTRRQTLLGVIDSSWELLKPIERTAFARCSVFRGGFDLPAAEAVLGDLGVHTADLLQRLRDSSMLRSLSGRRSVRFGMYESLADFAGRKLSEDERSRAWRLHALHYLGLGEELARAVQSPAAQQAQTRIGQEADNLLAVVDRYADTDRPLAARAALVADAHIGLTGPFDLDEEILRRVHPAPAPWGAPVNLALGRLMRRRSRFGEARPFLDDAIRQSAADEQREVEVIALCQASALARHVQDHRRASALLDSAEERVRPDDLHGLGWIHASRALLSWQVDGPLRSAVHHRRALETWRQAGDLRQLALSLNALGVIEMLSLRFEKAATWYEQAMTVHQNLGDAHGEAVAASNLGALRIQTGQMDEARQHLARASRRNRQLGNRRVEAAIQSNLGLVEALRGEDEAAQAWFDSARTMLRTSGAEAGLIGAASIAHAAFLLHRGELTDAETEARVALEVLKGPAGDTERASAKAVLAAALAWQGRFVEADVLASEAVDEGEREGAGNAALGRAHVDLARSRWAKALGDEPTDESASRQAFERWGLGAEWTQDAAVPGVQRLLRRSLGAALERSL